MICEFSIGIASIESPGDISLCTEHYQQVYRMLDARAHACKPDPERVESFLQDTVSFSDSIRSKNMVIIIVINQMLKSDVCMLSSEDIVLKLKAKKENLEKVVHELECLTPEASDIVECCLYKTVLHACELVASDRPFLFPNMYRLFMQYLGDYDIDCSEVCV